MAVIINSIVKRAFLIPLSILLILSCDLFKSQEPVGPDPNNKPVVTNAIISPANPLMGETVELSYNFNDEDGDDDLSEIEWFRNNQLTGVEGKFFDPDSAQEDDRIHAEITAYDGIDEGNTIKSNTVVYVREKFAPNISYLANVAGVEDEIEVGSVVKDLIGKITDQDHSLDELVIELTQTNPSLINLQFADNYEKLIIESYQEGGSGENNVTIKVTDPDGLVDQETFRYSISAMTDIEGSILDSDTWLTNNALQAWLVIKNAQNGIVIADTVWADANGKYKTQIEPMAILDIEAGYRSLDRTQPMSFITTARGVLASNDISGVDIMAVTYLNNNMTPSEFRLFAWQTNFTMGSTNYEGAKAPSKDMTDKILKTGLSGDELTNSELNDLQRVKNDSINTHLKYPFPQEETTYYDGIYDEYNTTTWEKERLGNPSVGVRDFNNDGIIDRVRIITRGDAPDYHNDFISNLLEEGYASRGEFFSVLDPILEGKTIAYEFKGIEWVYPADIKFIKFIEGVGYQIGYLQPKMPIDDV